MNSPKDVGTSRMFTIKGNISFSIATMFKEGVVTKPPEINTNVYIAILILCD